MEARGHEGRERLVLAGLLLLRVRIACVVAPQSAERRVVTDGELAAEQMLHLVGLIQLDVGMHSQWRSLPVDRSGPQSRTAYAAHERGRRRGACASDLRGIRRG